MDDRELLELAAKAAGFKYGVLESRNYANSHQDFYVWEGGMSKFWNPLADDGDALRLAVKLEMKIAHRTVNVDVSIGSVSASEYVPTYKDRNEATRRAIVRAAAEIGRASK